MSSDFTREDLNHNLYLLAREYKKQNGKDAKAELILVGGSSVIINYGFRGTTSDIDSIIVADSNMRDVIHKIADEQEISSDWLNDDFVKTDSYSPKLVQHSKFYKTFCNCIDVRTVDSEYLIAMKLRSARDYKYDLSDVVGIISESAQKKEQLDKERIQAAYVELYGEPMPKDTEEALENIISAEDYEELYYKAVDFEKASRKKLQEFESKYENVLNKENVVDVLDTISDHNLEIENIRLKKSSSSSGSKKRR